MQIEIEEPGTLINKLLKENSKLEKENVSLKSAITRLKKVGGSPVEVKSHQRGGCQVPRKESDLPDGVEVQ